VATSESGSNHRDGVAPAGAREKYPLLFLPTPVAVGHMMSPASAGFRVPVPRDRRSTVHLNRSSLGNCGAIAFLEERLGGATSCRKLAPWNPKRLRNGWPHGGKIVPRATSRDQPVGCQELFYPFLRLARETLQKETGTAYSLLAESTHRQWGRSLLLSGRRSRQRPWISNSRGSAPRTSASGLDPWAFA